MPKHNSAKIVYTTGFICTSITLLISCCPTFLATEKNGASARKYVGTQDF